MSRGERGFTLIETLVALAVFGIAALALLRLEGLTVASTARLQDRLMGQIVARNVGLWALTDPVPPAIGALAGEDGNGGRTWPWTRTTTRIADGALLRIDVTVRDQGGTPVGALTLFRDSK